MMAELVDFSSSESVPRKFKILIIQAQNWLTGIVELVNALGAAFALCTAIASEIR